MTTSSESQGVPSGWSLPPYNFESERLLAVNVTGAMLEGLVGPECAIREVIKQAQGTPPLARVEALLASLDPERCEAFSSLVNYVVQMRQGAATPVHIYVRLYDKPPNVTPQHGDEMVTFGYPIVELPRVGTELTTAKGCWLRFTNSPDSP